MVKFRGIEICIVSQFDIRRLPEFAHRISPVGKFNATSATCYVPIYPGSQIWFEYTIDGPHPPKSAYFFKLFINSQFITSWDCTAKYGYHGKACYLLQQQPQQQDQHDQQPEIHRHGFQFSNSDEDNQQLITMQDDCIEIRVHRIEHRKRIRSPYFIPQEGLSTLETGKLKLVDGGHLEPGRPQRRYKYQLLDPLDTPYATFKYFYRSSEWLEMHGLVNVTETNTPDDSIDDSTIWFDPSLSEVFESSPSGYGSPDYSRLWNKNGS